MPVIESIALAIATRAGYSATMSLLREVVGLQNQQVAVLKELREDVRRMVEGPWRKATLLLEEAAATTVVPERRARLQEARDSLFGAYSLEPGATARRATIAIDLALVHGLLNEPPHARRWAAKAHADQSAAVRSGVDIALNALNSRASMLKAPIDGDFWSLLSTSRRKDPAGTERWIRERYERGRLPAELPPKARLGGNGVPPFLPPVARAETTSAGGRELMRLHRMVRNVEEYRRVRLTFEPDAHVAQFELPVDLSHRWHARIVWQPVAVSHQDQILRWRGSHDVVDVAFSPDGDRLVVACGSAAHVLDSRTGDEVVRLRHLRNTLGAIWAVAYSPDGRTIATGAADHTARVWAADNGRALVSLRHLAVLGFVRAVAFSADGGLLATAAGDHTVRLWDLRSGRQLLKLVHDRPARSVAVSPDSGRLASAGEDDTVRLWSSRDGAQVLRLHQPRPTQVAFSPTGRLLAASGDRTRVWDIRDGREVGGCASPGTSVAFSPDGRSLAVGGQDSARVVDAFNGAELSSFPHGGLIRAVAFSPDGRRLATGGDDGTVRVWRLDSPDGRHP
jgi:hypothetical protein